MSFYERVQAFLTDDRLLANLIALHVVLGLVLFLSFLLRKLLVRGGDQLTRMSAAEWLDGVGKEALRRVRALLFWCTVGLLGIAVVSGMAYHLFGRDVRVDMAEWYRHLTPRQLMQVGLALGGLVLLVPGVYFAFRLVRTIRASLQDYTLRMLPVPQPESLKAAPSEEDAPLANDLRNQHEETIRRWFGLLERFALVTVFLAGLWVGGHIVHLSGVVDAVVLFAIRLLAIFMVARLLTLGCRTLSHALASLGNRHLGAGKYQDYWERVTRLFPFGERCFEAAVYISAATLLIRELEFIRVVADLGPRVVQCIGIFFVTRVVIELLTVLLNEAFGMHDETKPVDQKTETLLPLLLSICQYTLYFGSGVVMLGVLGVDTTPILAGAGILGLAAGLGASLVTDIVSGFFILFENQYLVGDIVKIGDAEGRVEAVSIRHTQVRDEQGKLHILPNGQIKSVVNFSKGFVNAVVNIVVPTTQSLDLTMRDMAEAGRRLRERRREVLGETIIQGLVDLNPKEMTIRAITRVQPGKHQLIQNEYRRMLKEVLDEQAAATAPRLAA